MNRATVAAFCAAAVCLLLLAGPGAAAPGGAPIRIGASLPLTGRFSEPGTAAKQGYEVWTRLVNETGGMLGRPVQLSIVDNASNQRTVCRSHVRIDRDKLRSSTSAP